jgi:hypothetical protein
LTSIELQVGCGMAWFINQYLCEDCKLEWEDEWSATCDDDCPHCGSRHMEPYNSIDVTEIVQEHNGTFLVLRMPDDAEDTDDYELIAEFKTREDAEDFVRNGDDESSDEPGPIGSVD